jgi:membrane protein YqaA with SNARE-associated domain
VTQETVRAGSLPTVEFTQAEPARAPYARAFVSAAAMLVITVASLWLAVHPAWVMGLGRWGYVGAFLISMIASATVILPAPGFAVVIAMGAALDPLLLGVVSGLGSALGELSGYLIGAGGRAFFPANQREQVERIHALTDRYGAPLLGALAALPLPLFDLAGIVAGVLRMNIVAFLIAVFIGKTIKYILLIFLAAGPIGALQQLVRLWGGG